MSPAPAVLPLSFSRASLDEFLRDLGGLGVDILACQLDAQVSNARLDVAISASVRAMRFNLGNRLHHLLGGETDSRTFGFLVGEQCPTRVKGREFSCGDILQVDPDSGLDAVVEPGFKGFTIAITEQRLRDVAGLIGLSDYASVAKGLGAEKPMPGALSAQLCHQAEQMMCLAQASPAAPAVEELLEFELPALLLRAWSGPDLIRIDRSTLRSRSRALQRAMEYIRNAGRQVVTVEQVCRASACSYSTLERAFREQFGLSPKRYLVHSRLSGVRQALLGGDYCSVTDAAVEWGFTHLGKFAADYERQFGELPSATVRRSPSLPVLQ